MASNTKLDYPALPPWGYHVSKLHLPAHIIAELLSEAAAHQYIPVFNEVGGKDEDPDHKQSRLPLRTSKPSDAMKMLHQELCFLVRMHARNYVPTVYSFMKSEKDGREQDPHQDYTPAAIAKATNKHPRTIPCSMIVALEESTKLKVFDSCCRDDDPARASVVELQPGWCILFRGDLIHCSVAYPKVIIRLHCYVTIEGVKLVPDIVTGVNEREFTCEHCGHQEATSGRICQHQFYCPRNPKGHVRVRKNRPKEATRKCLRCGKTYSAGGYRNHRKKSPPCMPTHNSTEL